MSQSFDQNKVQSLVDDWITRLSSENYSLLEMLWAIQQLTHSCGASIYKKVYGIEVGTDKNDMKRLIAEQASSGLDLGRTLMLQAMVLRDIGGMLFKKEIEGIIHGQKKN